VNKTVHIYLKTPILALRADKVSAAIHKKQHENLKEIINLNFNLLVIL
jgi:hypothetical protein